jgi:calreticulin
MSFKCSSSSSYIILIKCECFTDFKDDPELYVYPNLRYVGIELWQVTFSPFVLSSSNCSQVTDAIVLYQVKSGTLFDNVLVSDDPEYAKQLAEETWGKQKDVCGFFPFTLNHPKLCLLS